MARLIASINLQTLPSEARVRDNSEDNIGVTRGINELMRGVDHQYALWLNHDAELLPDTVEQCVKFMDAHPLCAVAGVKQLDTDDRDLITHGGTAAFFPAGEHLTGRVSQGHHTESKPFLWVNMAVCIIRTAAWRDLGGFDERFFLLAQDSDFCIRARLAGWQVWYCAEAVAIHRSDGVSGKPSPAQLEICQRDMDAFAHKLAGRGFEPAYIPVYGMD